MYWLFRLHNYKPSEVYNLQEGEKLILKALVRKEIEDRNRENNPEGVE